MIAHVGSYAENLEWVSGQLEKYPNMYIDVAARLAELGRVPVQCEEVFCEAQDRILFGTDCTPLVWDIIRFIIVSSRQKTSIFRISPKENFRDREDGQSTESDWKMRS